MTPEPTPPQAAPIDTWPRARLLVVDDEEGMRHFLGKALARRVEDVAVAGSAEEAQALLQRQRFDLAVLDIALPGRSGLDLLREMRRQGHATEVVLITAFADLDTAIEAIRAGAADFLLKPFRVAQLLHAVGRALERAQLRRENRVLRRALDRDAGLAPALIGRSIAMKGLQAALQRLGPVGSTVLLTGESGTGKELAAQALHRLGPGPAAPFVPVHCATMSPALIEAELFGQAGWDAQGHKARDGLFVHAQGGTLFLDEIGDLPLPLQSSLLRVLENRHIRPVGSEHEIPVDVRVVAASNRPLSAEVEAGRFRKDLYYRLQVVELQLPPLRAHKEDIPELVAHFLAALSRQLGLPAIAVDDTEMAYLQQYDWPGNVRELRNLLERSLIVGALNVSALYQGLQRQAGSASGGATDLQTLERQHIQSVLDSVQGDKTRAAQLLGISRRTLERRAAEWATRDGRD